jgi:hypothetical protein
VDLTYGVLLIEATKFGRNYLGRPGTVHLTGYGVLALAANRQPNVESTSRQIDT